MSLFHYSMTVEARDNEQLDEILKQLLSLRVTPDLLTVEHTFKLEHAWIAEFSSEEPHYNGTFWEAEDHEDLLHDLSVKDPDAAFELSGTDLEYGTDSFVKGFRGELYQECYAETFDPALTEDGWIPFDRRSEETLEMRPADGAIPEWAANTDWDLLSSQKQALVDAVMAGIPISEDVLNGLVNFLDAVGDWAEDQGLYVYPEVSETIGSLRKPPLSTLIKEAEKKEQQNTKHQTREKDSEPERR